MQIDSKYIQIGTLNFYAWKILDFEKKVSNFDSRSSKTSLFNIFDIFDKNQIN